MIKPLQSLTLKNNDGEDTTYVVASAPAIVETTEPADVASFSDGAEGIPVKSLIADINPVQNLNGQSAPYPAGGGKNLVDYLSCTGVGARNGTDTIYGNNVSVSGNVLTITQTYASNGGILKGIQHPSIPANTTFTLSMEVKSSEGKLTYGYGKYAGGGTSQVNNGVEITANTWTTITRQFTSQGDDVGLFIQPFSSGTLEVRNLQLEIGSSATTYAPYSNICPITGWTGMNVVVSPTLDAQDGTTYPISWEDEAGTVYGGTLDVTTGLLTVTHGIVEYDGSADESWTKGGVANECYIRNDAVKRFLDYRGQLFCDKLATYWHHETYVVQYGISAYGANNSYPSQNWLYVHLTNTTLTVADLKTWLQSNPITVCYPLATPVTYQLTPQAVLTILGQNNIWADTGDVEVAYCADTKMYIDKVIAAL